jgi:hypothetical protein
MNNIVKLAILILFFPSLLLAQNVIDGTQLLQQELDRYGTMDMRAGPVEDPQFPLVEKIEFRSETHDFLTEEQEYLFRVSPGTFKERKAQRELYRHWSQQPDWQMEDFLCDLSFDIQQDWLDLWFWQQNKDIVTEKLALLLQSDSLIALGLVELEADELVALRSEIAENQTQIKELNMEEKALLSYYNIQDRQADFKGLLSLEKLIDKIRIPTLQAADPMQKMEKIDYELEEKQLELDLEKAEKRQWLDFMQVRYQGPRSDPWEERISIGIGFILPNSANRQLKVKELEMEKQELQREKEVEEMEQNRDQQRWLTSILSGYEILQYKQDLYAQNNSELRVLAENMIQLEEYQAYYEIQKRLFKEERDLLRSRYKVYEEILEYYKKTELLCQDVERSILFPGN